MKSIIMITALFLGTSASELMAQGDLEKMKVFENWIGQWQGEGAIQMGPGEPKKSKVKETIEYKLGGMIVMIEGIGTTLNASTHQETVVHHAFGVISYDQATSQYKLKSYLKDGKTADAWLTVTGTNQYQWGFDIPNRKIRYSITIDPVKKTWNEIGESSGGGASWTKFFEMNLTQTK